MGILKSKRKRQMPEADLPSNSIMMQYDIMRKARGRSKSQKGPDTEGYEESQRKLESPKDEKRKEPDSLQEDMIHDHPSDEEDRSNVLFDGKAERIDPLQKELDEDEDSDDIVGRIMRKMRRK